MRTPRGPRRGIMSHKEPDVEEGDLQHKNNRFYHAKWYTKEKKVYHFA